MREKEQAKYEKIWSYNKYRKHSPGESLVDQAIHRMNMRPADSIIDFGCGTGRPAQKFKDLGFDVVGVDFADNCLDPGVDVEFHQACLWEPIPLTAEYGFCTDVMEHIPPEFVDDTLGHIANSVKVACYFQIATTRDGMGKLIGESLHLTVERPEWWSERLSKHFTYVTNISLRGKYCGVGYK